MGEKMQVARNCGGKHPGSGFLLALAEDLVIEECPNSSLDRRSVYLYRLFHGCHFAAPALGGNVMVQHAWPRLGGLMEQLSIVVEAFQFMRNEYAQIAEEAVLEKAREAFLSSET